MKRLIVKVLSQVPLQTVLIVPFVVQIVTAVGLTGYLSFRNGQQAVNNLATQLQREIAARIDERLDNYLEKPRLIARLNIDASRLGYLNWQNKQAVEHHFWQQLRQFDEIQNIYLATSKGELILVGRNSDGTLKQKLQKIFRN